MLFYHPTPLWIPTDYKHNKRKLEAKPVAKLLLLRTFIMSNEYRHAYDQGEFDTVQHEIEINTLYIDIIRHSGPGLLLQSKIYR